MSNGQFLYRIGTDICSIARVQKAYDRFGERLLNRILTDSEKTYVLKSKAHTPQRLAGRFAVKEATSKALGVGFSGVGFKEIETTREASGRPTIRLHGRAALLAQKLNLNEWQVTISHEKDYAVAFVLAVNNRA